MDDDLYTDAPPVRSNYSPAPPDQPLNTQPAVDPSYSDLGNMLAGANAAPPVRTTASAPPPSAPPVSQPPVSMQPAPSMPTAPPVSAPNLRSDIMAGNVAPPVSTDYKPAIPSSKSRWLNALAAGMVGFKNPEAGMEIAKRFREAPIARANEAYQRDVGEYNTAFNQGLAQQSEARAEANEKREGEQTAADVSYKNAQTKKLGEPTPDKLENVQQGYAGAIRDAITAGRDPATDPHVQAWKQAVEDFEKAQASSKAPTAEQDTIRATNLRAQLAAGKKLSPDDANWLKGHTQEKTIVPATTAIINQPNKDSARSDKSFQYNNSALDKIATPLDQLNQRLGRLNDTLAQKNPQADALVGPELLSVMAGGQGSGIRMNETEINRIVGGRSAWENLKAKIEHWSTNPDDARSITDDQDKQIRALVGAVQTKMIAKSRIIDDARQALIDSDDPREHRRIVADAKKKLDAIDAGPSGGGEKTYTDQDVQDAARQYHMSTQQIEQSFKAKGYKKQ